MPQAACTELGGLGAGEGGSLGQWLHCSHHRINPPEASPSTRKRDRCQSQAMGGRKSHAEEQEHVLPPVPASRPDPFPPQAQPPGVLGKFWNFLPREVSF